MSFLSLSKCIISCTILLSAGCNDHDRKSPVEKDVPATPSVLFDKLVGTWKNEDGKSFERWTKNKDGTFSSVVFSIKDADTSFSEEATIYNENENWIFANRVNNQNDGKTVKFIATQLTDSTVQFSNPAHDFPIQVNYVIVDPTTVRAFITGPAGNGNIDTFYFNYRKLN